MNPKSVSIPNQSQRIADFYHAATVKGAWYGPSLGDLLDQVTPELATLTPAPKGHSISELLQHLLVWNERIRNASDSNPIPPWEPDKEWAEATIPWNDLVERWKQSRDLLEQKILEFPSEDLGKQVPGRDRSYGTVFEGNLQHVVYHSGQIAMVLSILRSRSK